MRTQAGTWVRTRGIESGMPHLDKNPIVENSLTYTNPRFYTPNTLQEYIMGRPRKDGTTPSPTLPGTPNPKPALTPQAIINNGLRNVINQLEALPVSLENWDAIANLYATVQNPTPRDRALALGYRELHNQETVMRERAGFLAANPEAAK